MTLSAIFWLPPAEARHGAEQDQQRYGDDGDADDAPQGRGRDGDAEVGRRRFAAAVGAERGDIVAGDRLVRRRHLDLDLLLLVWLHTGDALGVELDLPAGRHGARHLDLFDRRGTVVAEHQDEVRWLAGRRLPAQPAVLAPQPKLPLTSVLQTHPE